MPSFKNLALCVTLVGLAGWPGAPSAQAAPPNEGLNQAMVVLKNRESARVWKGCRMAGTPFTSTSTAIAAPLISPARAVMPSSSIRLMI